MSDPLWRLRCPDGFESVRLDAELLAFNPISWQTHLLNAAAAAALEELTAGPRSVRDLALALCGDEPHDADVAEHMNLVESLVAELEELGLIEREHTGNAAG